MCKKKTSLSKPPFLLWGSVTLQVTVQMVLARMCLLGLLCCQHILQHCFLSGFIPKLVVCVSWHDLQDFLFSNPLSFFPAVSEYLHLFYGAVPSSFALNITWVLWCTVCVFRVSIQYLCFPTYMLTQCKRSLKLTHSKRNVEASSGSYSVL